MKAWNPTWLRSTLGLGIALGLALSPLISSAQDVPEGDQPPALADAEVDPIVEAWTAPASDLAERVERTLQAAHHQDRTALDTLARAALRLDTRGVSDLSKAEAAVRLAPDLPLAHAALASARAEVGDFSGALGAGWRAVAAVPGHLEASLWVSATASWLAVLALLAASLCFLLLQGVSVLPSATHDLGDRIPGATPGYARVAWMAFLLGIPWLLGEGVLGFILALFALVACYGPAASRRAGMAAAALLLAALFPLSQWSGSQLGALGADPLADAVWRAERGALDPVAAARMDALAANDRLGRRALARRARRTGAFETADSIYAELVAEPGVDAGLLNDAANLKIALGQDQEAIALYQMATRETKSAVVWFNLAQAYASRFRTDEHQDALTMAQSLDVARVRELTDRLARRGSGTADLPLPEGLIRERMTPDRVPDVGTALRARVAPGHLGRTPLLAVGLFAAVGILGTVLGSRLGKSRGCVLCGGRICTGCHGARSGDVLCAACGPHAERSAGLAGMAWTLRRGAIRVLKPMGWSVSDVLTHRARPELALLSLVAAAGAVVLALGHDGVVPDPLAAGGAGPMTFFGMAAALTVLHLGVALASRRVR